MSNSNFRAITLTPLTNFSYLFYGVDFGVGPNATNGLVSDITGSLPNVTTCVDGFCSFWFKTTNQSFNLISHELGGVVGSYVDVGMGYKNGVICVPNIICDLTISPCSIEVAKAYKRRGDGGETCYALDYILTYTARADNPPNNLLDGNWHHVLWSWTMPTAGQLYIDNAPLSVGIENDWSAPSDASNYISADMELGNAAWNIYGDPGSDGVNPTLSLAEMFVRLGESVNITDPTVRAKFINPNTLKPVGLGNGSAPFGSDALLPQIFLSGNKDNFQIDRSTSNPQISFSVSGTIQNATDDPFGNTPPP